MRIYLFFFFLLPDEPASPSCASIAALRAASASCTLDSFSEKEKQTIIKSRFMVKQNWLFSNGGGGGSYSKKLKIGDVIQHPKTIFRLYIKNQKKSGYRCLKFGISSPDICLLPSSTWMLRNFGTELTINWGWIEIILMANR